jgi:hypothetical protein
MEFDYVIIGSGLGGGVLSQFIDTEKKIAIIEAGAYKGNSENVSYVNKGLDFRWPITRSIEVGGTSNLWHGVLGPLDKIDYKKRHWIEDSGWPLNEEDLDPYYKKASEFLHVANNSLFEPEISKKKFELDISKIHMSGFFDLKFFQQPLPPLRVKDFLKGKNKSNNIKIYINTIALKLIADESNTQVINSVKCFCKESNSFVNISGKTFIISCGALETPRLLLNSVNCGFNKNSNIGKYLMDHPMGNCLQVKFKNPIKAPIFSDVLVSKKNKIKAGFILSANTQQEFKFPNHNFFLRPSFRKGIDQKVELVKLSLLAVRNNKVSFKDIYNIVTNINLARQILAYKLSLNVKFKYADLFLMSEQTPYKDSCIKLSSEKDEFGYPKAEVNWKLNEYDKKNITEYINFIYKNCFSLDDVEFTVTPPESNWEQTFTSAAHHVGTARMGEDHLDGVVDKNLKMFDTDNTYICDGSVFRTSGNVNSGFTIISLAIRLAEYLNNND